MIYEVCFFEKKNLFNSQPVPWPSCAFQPDLQRQLDEWTPKPQGFLIETWSQTQVDGGGGKTGRNKSRIFVLLWPESQNQRWNFVVPALFCASQSFHTDGSGLRIRRFIHQRERSPVPVPALVLLCQSILCSRRNENEKLILKPSIGRLKKKKTDKKHKTWKGKMSLQCGRLNISSSYVTLGILVRASQLHSHLWVGWRPSTYHDDGHLSIVLAAPPSFEKMGTVKLSGLPFIKDSSSSGKNLGGSLHCLFPCYWVGENYFCSCLSWSTPLYPRPFPVTIS